MTCVRNSLRRWKSSIFDISDIAWADARVPPTPFLQEQASPVLVRGSLAHDLTSSRGKFRVSRPSVGVGVRDVQRLKPFRS